MKKLKLSPLLFFGRVSAILPTLILLNLFFGWILFGFYNWFLIGVSLVFLFIINIALFTKSFKANLGTRDYDDDIIDIKGNALDDVEIEDKAYQDLISCPHCNSYETRFVGPHDDMNEYECLKCGIRFEVEE